MAQQCRQCGALDRGDRRTSVPSRANPDCDCNHARSFHGGGGVGQRCMAMGCHCSGTRPSAAGTVAVVLLHGELDALLPPALLHVLGIQPGDKA